MAFEVWEKMECEDEAADKSVAEFKRDQKKGCTVSFQAL